VAGFLKQFEGMGAPAVERQEFAIGGGPAEVMEVVPGRTGSREVWALTNNGARLYRFIFTPSVRDFPQAQADVEELFNTVTAHFAFLAP
jgi:hypothetical protein